MKPISMKMNGRITFGDWKITKDFWISNSNGTRNIYFTVTNVWDQSFMKKEECAALILSSKIDLNKHLLPRCSKFHFNFFDNVSVQTIICDIIDSLHGTEVQSSKSTNPRTLSFLE